MLHKEEAGLTVDRSLEGAPADVQSFQIYMSGEWREAFDKIRNTLVGEESVAEVMNDNRYAHLLCTYSTLLHQEYTEDVVAMCIRVI